ncbi:DUF5696 domain-containing protein [Gracilibacillus marinus]|uniref:DUF5696 domain-containing protein n=1 Tax=Gracilibacillus marinus TaxID=630535 RepID=A0ABV8VVR6_9BACI
MKRIQVILFVLLLSSFLFSQSFIMAEEMEENISEETEGDILIDEEVEQGISQEELESIRQDYTQEMVNQRLAEMVVVLVSDVLELYLNQQTAEIAVKNKQTKEVWFSNPLDLQTDTIAVGENKEILQSQFSLMYFNQHGQTSWMHSNLAVRNKQVEFEKDENKLTVIYKLGDISKGLEAIPQRITKERFETIILDKITDEKTREDFKKRYLYLEEEEIYERRDASFPKVIIEQTLQLFKEIGYDEEELGKDLAEMDGESGGIIEKPVFTIPVEYSIEDDDFVVSVHTSDIKQNDAYPISQINILPFFGAANEHRNGFMFVPDGSGALIHLNNGKTNYRTLDIPLYGEDLAEFSKRKMEIVQAARLPVFGMNQENRGFIGIIEDGNGIASIVSDVAGRIHLYNNVYASFTIKKKGDVTLSGGDRESTVALFQQNPYKGDLQIRYSFLDEEANYSNMARKYREYLLTQHKLNRLTDGDIPFYLDLIGAITKRKTFLGIPYQSLEALTTFNQAQEIIEELQSRNIKALKVLYTGWFNKGYSHTVPTNISIDNELGGKDDFQQLDAYLKDNHISFYPSVSLMEVHKDSFDFSPSKDGARFINKKIAEIYPYNKASFLRDTSKKPSYLLAPNKFDQITQQFLKTYAELHMDNVAIKDVADILYGDYQEKNGMDREATRKSVIDQLTEVKEVAEEIITFGGNDYALPFSKHILEIPATSSQFNIIDQTIPFYQMVIHGYIDYAYNPHNLSTEQSMKKQLLLALETGANPYFRLFYEEPTVIKNTEYNHLYSANYQLWKEDAVDLYDHLNKVLKTVRTLPISSHEEIESNVKKTVYGDEKTVYVNYNHYDVTVDGVQIEAEGYVWK